MTREYHNKINLMVWVAIADLLTLGLLVSWNALANQQEACLDAELRAKDLGKDKTTEEKKVADLRARVAALTKEKLLLTADKADLQQKRSAAELQFAKELADLNTQLANLTPALASLKEEHKALVGSKAGLKADLERLQKTLGELGGVHRELLGLKSRTGKLTRVAILIDTSGSMDTSENKLIGNRWAHTQGIITAWAQHLAVDRAVVITFAEKAERVGEYRLRQEEDRKRLVNTIKTWKPDGGTATLAALRLAYQEKDLDAIVLFTDGAPTRPDKNTEPIVELCKQNKDVPINAIGVGDYFSPNLSKFLLELATATNGSFQGR